MALTGDTAKTPRRRSDGQPLRRRRGSVPPFSWSPAEQRTASCQRAHASGSLTTAADQGHTVMSTPELCHFSSPWSDFTVICVFINVSPLVFLFFLTTSPVPLMTDVTFPGDLWQPPHLSAGDSSHFTNALVTASCFIQCP